MSAAAARFIVSGRVQGVCFRAETRRLAQSLGLCGHAHNLVDGRVEVLAVGDAAALARLESWLWHGPERAQVVAVVAAAALPDGAGDGFDVG